MWVEFVLFSLISSFSYISLIYVIKNLYLRLSNFQITLRNVRIAANQANSEELSYFTNVTLNILGTKSYLRYSEIPLFESPLVEDMVFILHIK